jgi:hypothetical protein
MFLTFDVIDAGAVYCSIVLISLCCYGSEFLKLRNSFRNCALISTADKRNYPCLVSLKIMNYLCLVSHALSASSVSENNEFSVPSVSENDDLSVSSASDKNESSVSSVTDTNKLSVSSVSELSVSIVSEHMNYLPHSITTNDLLTVRNEIRIMLKIIALS